ncbi:MAG: DNA/RNA nuclease SfsA [Bacillota bacterium]
MPWVQCIDSLPRSARLAIDEDLVCGRFVRRVNRFVAEVEILGEIEAVHLANSGRLSQLLIPGNWVGLADRPSPTRRTSRDLVLAALLGESCSRWILVDSRLPVEVVWQSLRDGDLPEFCRLREVRREVPAGRSRFDFQLTDEEGGELCWMEVKSVTLAVSTPSGIEARFPDAPTERGVRHLRDLTALVRRGDRCAVAFAVCHPGAVSVAAHPEVDPGFARALWDAAMAGVEVYAYRILSDPRSGSWLEGRLPVRMEESCRNYT